MSAEAAPAKVAAPSTLAAIGVDLAQLEVFTTSLKKFGVPVTVKAFDSKHLPKNVTAFVVRLEPGVEATLSAIRATEGCEDTLIYAIGTPADVLSMHLVEFDISVLLSDLSVASVTEAVQSTYQLLLHQLRRYARIPIVTAVQMGTGENCVHAISKNVSAGGISVVFLNAAAAAQIQADTVLQVSFSLPGSGRFHLSSVPVMRSEKAASFQFIGSPDQEELKDWIDRYLQK
ncbi:MAG: hypothetical protein JWO13_3555 [Acidobacteriales bacterium]|nr:hypothetical protein [Terriglobales bacterium]